MQYEAANDQDLSKSKTNHQKVGPINSNLMLSVRLVECN